MARPPASAGAARWGRGRGGTPSCPLLSVIFCNQPNSWCQAKAGLADYVTPPATPTALLLTALPQPCPHAQRSQAAGHQCNRRARNPAFLALDVGPGPEACLANDNCS